MPIASLSDYAKESGGSDGASGKDLPPYGPGGIYHEKQVAAMCAVHAVNNMLQGRHFEYYHFGACAEELDREEARLTGGVGLGDGTNARADGFFNVQVMQKVLTNRGYVMQSAGGENGLREDEDTANETAFILNKNEHWFSLRRIGNEWFDLNSCIRVPAHYTPADVRFHIRDAIKQGYTVFVVRGPFPTCPLEEDSKKLVEAVQGCGRPDQGYSLFAGGGQSLGGGSAQVASGDVSAMRAARLSRLGISAGPASGASGKSSGPVADSSTSPSNPPVASLMSQAPEVGLASSTSQAAGAAEASAPQCTVQESPLAALARERAAKHAAKQQEAVTQLLAMGFDEESAKTALQRFNGNVDQAAESLLQEPPRNEAQHSDQGGCAIA